LRNRQQKKTEVKIKASKWQEPFKVNKIAAEAFNYYNIVEKFADCRGAAL
jgi:hypothetical protein